MSVTSRGIPADDGDAPVPGWLEARLRRRHLRSLAASGGKWLDGEPELIELVKARDQDALRVLLSNHSESIKAVWRSQGFWRPEEIQELQQELMTAVWRNIASRRGESFRAWVQMIASNKGKDMIESAVKTRWRIERSAATTPEATDSRESAVITRDEVRWGICHLKKQRHRDVLLLVLQGLSEPEIAATVGIKTARNDISDAYKELAKILTAARNEWS